MVLVVPPEEADEVLDALDAVLVGVVLHLQHIKKSGGFLSTYY